MFGIFSDMRFFKLFREKTKKEKSNQIDTNEQISKKTNTPDNPPQKWSLFSSRKAHTSQSRNISVHFLANETGNIFFTLFGAVMLVGLLGAVTVATMRGPLSTMVMVQSRSKAQSEMDIASRLSLLEATQLASSGDCDGDGYVEPLEYKDAAGLGPTGGGFLPDAIASSHVDPWGMAYGYCAWDAGLDTGNVACDVDSTGTNERLSGNGLDDNTYTVVAIISGGPNQTFETTCIGGSTPSVVKGGDDIVTEFTYSEAIDISEGLWNLKSGDPTTAEIAKNLEVTGAASFSEGIDLSGSSVALQLGAASMLFPDDTTLSTCNAANDGLIRINTSTTPNSLELCDDPTGWVSASASSVWLSGAGDDVYYDAATPQVGIGTTTPDDTLDVAGTFEATGATTLGSTLGVTGNTTLGGTLGVTGATTLSSTLGVTGATTLSSTLGVSGATTLSGTLDAQGNIGNSGGDVTFNDDVDITGTLDVQTSINNSTGSVTISDELEVTGNIYNNGGDLVLNDSVTITGNVSDSDSDFTIDDNLDVNGNIDASGDIDGDNITAATDLSAGGDVITSNEFLINAVRFGPPDVCSSDQKLQWSNATGWSCANDIGGSGTAIDLDDLGDVAASGPSDGDCIVYNNVSGDWEATSCTTAAASVFEVVSNVIRERAAAGSYANDDFVIGSATLNDDLGTTDDNARFFFDKDRAAFRAGTSNDSNYMDEANIGMYSFGAGYMPRATGQYSVAMGKRHNSIRHNFRCYR